MGRRLYHIDTTYFHEIDSPAKAYWLGFLAADADITATPKKYRVTLALSDKDRAHVAAFGLALGAAIPIRTLNVRGRQYARLDVASVALVKDLIRQGVGPRKSHTVAPWRGPVELLRHYWRGVWDGDGSFTKAGWMQLVGNRPMMQGFRRYAAETLGIEVPIRPHKNIYDLRYWKISEVAALAAHLYLNLDGSPALGRKAERACVAINRTPKLRDWSHLTAEMLASLKTQHGTWKAVATSLGIKSYCVLWKVRRRLGV